MPHDASFTPRLILVLVAVLAMAWFTGLGHRKLIHPDEGRYAEIAREMAVTGDFVTPRLNGLKYFEKPPLQYWATALAFRAFGVGEWTARLWPAASAFVALLFVGYAGFRLAGIEVGAHSALALAGMVGYVINAHFLSLDAGLAAFLTIAVAAFLVAQRPDASPASRRRWMLVAWGAAALAMLSKGLIALVLPGAALVGYSLLQRDFAVWCRLHVGAGLAVFLAITLPWFVAVSLANPEFLQFFFVHEHFQRFLTTEHRRTGAWWYFVPVLAVGALPWLLFLFAGARQLVGGTAPGPNGFSWQRFLVVYAAVVFVFFSLSGSKLPSYILPMFPALALLTGWLLPRLPRSWLGWLTVPLAAAAALGCAAMALVDATVLTRFVDPARQPLDPILAFARWIASGLAVSVGGGALALLAFRRRASAGLRNGVAAIAVSALVATQVALAGYDAFRGTRSAFDLVEAAKERAGALRGDVPFYQVEMYDQTAPFYLRRTTTLVAFRDELALGIDAEPQRAIATVDAWKPLWTATGKGYALMSDDTFARLAAEGLPMRELARDSRRVLASRQ